MGTVSGTGRTLALLALGLIGASFVLQLVDSISVPYIKKLGFLEATFNDLPPRWNVKDIQFGIWGWSADVADPDGTISSSANLDNYDGFLSQYRKSFGAGPGYQEPFLENLPYVLVLQPISAGFTGVASGAALLAICINSFLWVLAALWALALSIASTVIELILFIVARDRFDDAFRPAFADKHYYNVKLGKGMWIQVAALAAVVVGTWLMIWAYAVNTSYHRKHRDASLSAVSASAPVPSTSVPVTGPNYDYTTPSYPYSAYAQPGYGTGGTTAYDEPYAGTAGVGAYGGSHAGRYDMPGAHERRSAVQPPDMQVRVQDDEPKITTRSSKRHHKRHHDSTQKSRSTNYRYDSNLDGDVYDDEKEAPPRHSYEYDYDYDAFPSRRISYLYGDPSYVHHRSSSVENRYTRPRRGPRSGKRDSYIYPDDYGLSHNVAARRKAQDELRWKRLSHDIMY